MAVSASLVSNSLSLDQALAEVERLNTLIEAKELPPVSYSWELNNEGGDSAKFEQLIDKVITFVSKYYALFPRLGIGQRQELRARGVSIDKDIQISNLPPQEECDQFERNLKTRILTNLSKHSKLGMSIRLSTDWLPEKILSEVCETSFSQLEYQENFFPHKTFAFIGLDANRTWLLFNMKLTSVTIGQN